MNRALETATAGTGALAGAIIWGPVGGVIGAMAGYVMGRIGRHKGGGNSISASNRKEMEMALNVAMAVNWGIRPILIACDDDTRDRILSDVFDGTAQLVLADITLQSAVLKSTSAKAFLSGIPPITAMRGIKRKYGHNRFKRDVGVRETMAEIVISYYNKVTNYREAYPWYLEWSKAIGTSEDEAARLWGDSFEERWADEARQEIEADMQ